MAGGDAPSTVEPVKLDDAVALEAAKEVRTAFEYPLFTPTDAHAYTVSRFPLRSEFDLPCGVNGRVCSHNNAAR